LAIFLSLFADFSFHSSKTSGILQDSGAPPSAPPLLSSTAMRLLSRAIAATVVAGFCLPAAALTQSGTSAIAGVVRDASGGVIPGAHVRVVNTDTGVAIDAFANEQAMYRVPALMPGRYRVEADADGFEPRVIAGVVLEVSQTVAVDITLEIGRQSETVNVLASHVPLVESQSSAVTQTVTREMLAALPLPNRAAASLAALAPGVVMIDMGTGTAENYPVFSVAGGRARNQTFLLDGGNATNAVGLTRPQQLTSLPVDAMQEFQVASNNYAAEFGHSTGGVISMSTRAGTNTYRGSVFESHRNEALDARNAFASSKPAILLNQFGGTLGGPARRDRTFFFGTWERTRQRTGSPVVSTVPTVLNRTGNFSDLVTATGERVPIYDPLTRQPFPGNVIPADRLDPVAMLALAHYPLPNAAGTATHAANFVGNSLATLERDIVVGRVDHALSNNDRLTARYYLNDSGTNVTGSYGNPVADPDADSTDVRVQSLLAAYTHIFPNQWANDLRVTYLRRKFIDERPNLGSNPAASLQLNGVSDQAFPHMAIAGYASLSGAAVSRSQTPITDLQVLDSLSWFQGRHALKVGFEFRGGGNSEVRDRGSSGSFSFSPLYTSNLGAAHTGSALATFLLGAVNSASVQVSDRITTRASYVAVYAQDDWRLSDRLTVNLGLRYDLELPRREIDNRMNAFDPLAINPVSGTPGIVTFAGRDGVPERAFATDVNNIGPRAGFAYQLTSTGRTVLRGGTGIFYGQTVSATIGDAAALGFSTSASFVTAEATTQYAFLLRNGVPAYARPVLNSALGAVPVGARPNTSVSFFNPAQVAPLSYQVNLGVQHELGPGLVLEAGYMGNESRNLPSNDLTLNQVTPELMGPGDTQRLRPFPQFSNVTWINPSIGKSSYHGAFGRAQKRFSGGLSLLAHYTWSRFLDDAESENEYGQVGSYMDAYHRELDWGTSGTDVPHHVVLSVLYEIPRFNTNPVVRHAVGGWRLGLLETLMSGAPFTVITTANTTNAFAAGPLRPDLVGDPRLPRGERTLARWFNTGAFANPRPFAFGNSPRSLLRGPALITTDVTIEKSVPVTGRVKLDLRVEAYNVLNRVNYNVPGVALGAPDFGVITSARPARTVQLGVRLSF
jgi:hypothetical protein